MASRYWRCRRVQAGEVCGELNLATKKKCHACGKLRPKVKRPAHRAVLAELPYAKWVDLFGEFCGICGAEPSASRRLDRDHDHKTGAPRGLLCHRCNRALPNWADEDWYRKAATYLRDATTAWRRAA